MTLQQIVPRGSPSFWWRLYCVSQTSRWQARRSICHTIEMPGKSLPDQPQLEPQWWENYDTRTSSETRSKF